MVKHIDNNPTAVFAIRAEDALSWFEADRTLAGVAERCGMRIRPSSRGYPRTWEIWATSGDMAALKSQLERSA